MGEQWAVLRRSTDKLREDLACLAVDLEAAVRAAAAGLVPDETTAKRMMEVAASARAIAAELALNIAAPAGGGLSLSVQDLLRAIEEGEAREAATARERKEVQRLCGAARALRHVTNPFWPPLSLVRAQIERIEAGGAEGQAAREWIADLLRLLSTSDVAECAALVARLCAAFTQEVTTALQIALAAQAKQLEVAPLSPDLPGPGSAGAPGGEADVPRAPVAPRAEAAPSRTPPGASSAAGTHAFPSAGAVALFSPVAGDALPLPASGRHLLLGRFHSQAMATPPEPAPSSVSAPPTIFDATSAAHSPAPQAPETCAVEPVAQGAADVPGGVSEHAPSNADRGIAVAQMPSPSDRPDASTRQIEPDAEQAVEDRPPVSSEAPEVADAPRPDLLTATQAPPQPKPPTTAAAADIVPRIWGLIEAGEESLALLLVKTLEKNGEADLAGVPVSSVLEISVLSRWGADRPELHPAFQQREAALAARGLDAHDEAVALFAAGALGARALLVTGSDASEVLGRLEFHGRAGIISELRDAILAFSRFGIPLTPELLRGARTIDAAEAARDRALGKLATWHETNRGALMRFARATNVWRAWLREDGVIGTMVGAAMRGDVDRVRGFLAQWSPSGTYWREQLHHTDRQLAGSIAKTAPIEGAVLRNDFPNKLGELQKLCVDLLDAHDRRSAPQENEHLHPRVEECRRRLLNAIQALQPRLGALRADLTADRLRAAAHAVERRVAWLEHFLQTDSVVPEVPLDPDEVLAGDLLRVEGVRLDRRFRVTSAPPLDELCARMEQAAERGLASLVEVAQAAEARGNTRTLRQVLATATRFGSRDAAWQGFQARLSQSVERAARQRDERALEVETNLERALVENLLPERDIVVFRARVQAVRVATEEELELDELFPILDDIKSSLDIRRAERATELSDRLARLELDQAQRDRISGAIERRDLQVAEELIAAVERGDLLLTGTSRRDPFTEFFPALCQRIHDWLDDGWGQLRTSLRERAPATTPVIDLRSVDDDKRRSSALKLMDAWRAAKRMDPGRLANSADERQRLGEHVRSILQELDWQTHEVTVTSVAKAESFAWVTAITDPLQDLPRFIVPHYGSRAGGRYRILCAWNRPPEERLLHQVSGNPEEPNAPVMVFFFARLSETKRRALARLCREQRRAVLVLDEVLLAFLTGEHAMRLPTFLACATPFTTMSPYTTTAGRVDPEMFFGRLRERDLIWDPSGAHLLYGGRQLGKTALLRAIERERHNPAQGVVVQWIDLKEEGIGHARAIDDIWTLIASRLRPHGVISGGITSYDGLRTRIEDWLGREPGRRVLLLLDEADAFLRADAASGTSDQGEGFERVSRLKALMNSTGGRFKVVFAGLHNVQRTARNVNSPLAHLGEPICIGPLFGGGGAPSVEAKAALSLVREPMEALGFRFESEDLPLRILAHTNWYPSLTQLFCRELLEHMLRTSSDAQRARFSPPYTITAKDIEEAYRGQNLRKEILERFRITLDLDRRYRVIALCIAAETARSRVSGINDGFSLDWIRRQCLFWWDHGFHDSRTNDAFRALLDEMVGLGVLRTTTRDRYSLRNPNVLNLLGTVEEIDRDLEDAITQEATPAYEPGTFRRAAPGMSWLRNPLTASQEAKLLARSHGIRVVFGLTVSGIHEVARFVDVPGADGTMLRHVRSIDDFQGRLDRLADGRDNEVLVALVPHTAPWDESWLQVAADKLRRLRSRRCFLRVAFLADGERAWKLGDPPIQADVDYDTISLEPWAPAAIQRLLSDLHTDEAAWQDLHRAAGGWGWFVGKVADELKTGALGGMTRVKEVCAAIGPEWRRTVIGDLPLPTQPVLRVMASYGEPLITAEILDLIDADARDLALVERTLRWGQRVGVVDMAAGGAYELNKAFGAAIAFAS